MSDNLHTHPTPRPQRGPRSTAGHAADDGWLSPPPVDSPGSVLQPRLHAHGMSLIDGCPECVLNTEAPTVATPIKGGWRCGYRCSDCGHRWTTSWGN